MRKIEISLSECNTDLYHPDFGLPFSDAGNSTCFRLLSEEGVAALRRSLDRISDHIQSTPRIPRLHRGTYVCMQSLGFPTVRGCSLTLTTV